MATAKFVAWLEREMGDRRWTSADLARAAGVYTATVTRIRNGDRQPGADFCRGVARAFELPPDWVFRLAGLLPPLPGTEDDLTLGEINEIAKNLSPEERREAREYLLWRYRSS
jgi:transcriptional regulator with XRE-family HTH domain